MGHKVGYKHRPHRSSLAFWPRVRAKRIYPRVKWKECEGIGGFPVYKVGMTHAIVIDNRPTSITKGKKIFMPLTVLEAPPIKVIGVRFYKDTPEGKKSIGDVIIREKDIYLKRKIPLPKKEGKSIEDYNEFDDLRLIIKTQPHLIKLKKTPEILEIGVGGTPEEKLSIAKQYFGKEIKVNEVFKEGELVDVFGITKGKGTQGSVKRHGVAIRSHKSEKTKRAAGTLAPERPRKVAWQVPQFGQMGFHSRVELNKWIIKIGSNPDEINVKGGFKGYGIVRSDYLLVKGSVIGPRKRMLILRKAYRPNKLPKVPPQIKYLSLTSHQGVGK